jgi:uncharacterized protein
MSTQLILKKKPKGVTILDGFPGIGLIGTITTEFLIEHLKTEQIGSIVVDSVPAIVAVHGNRVIEPISIHYNKKYNIVLIHAISMGDGLGWSLAKVIQKIAGELQAKEIVSVEGVGATQLTSTQNVYFFTNNESRRKELMKFAKPLQEGIVVGVTGALLACSSDCAAPITAIFGETQSNMPDSKAAATIIQALDKYLKLDVDPKPLLKQAKEFEKKLRTLVGSAQKTTEMQKKKTLSYFG